MERKKQYNRYGVDYWLKHIKGWEQSGLSHRVYCRQHQLALSTFYQWKKRLSGNSFSSSEPSTLPEFIDLSVPSIPLSNQDNLSWDIELSLGSGVVLRLSQRSCG